MKNHNQKLKEEFGIYLQMVRADKRLKQKTVAQRLGYDSSNFVSSVEQGRSPIPFDRIIDYAYAYEIPVHEFARLAIVTQHNDLHKVFMEILSQDKELATTAARVHTSKKPSVIKVRKKILNPGLSSRALDKMREYIAENKELLPEKAYANRLTSEPAE